MSQILSSWSALSKMKIKCPESGYSEKWEASMIGPKACEQKACIVEWFC